MTPMSNPLASLIGMVKNHMRPEAIIQQIVATDPQARQAIQMMQGKSPAQLRQMAMNMAREQGVNINDVLRQLGVNIPSDR